jgi:hypothetical protein
MRWLPLKWHKAVLGKPGKGLLLLALFLSVLAVADVSSLHKALHPNAGSPDHQCAAKLLSSGQVHTAASDAVPFFAVVPICVCVPRDNPLPAREFLHLPPDRGPPALLA